MRRQETMKRDEDRVEEMRRIERTWKREENRRKEGMECQKWVEKKRVSWRRMGNTSREM